MSSLLVKAYERREAEKKALAKVRRPAASAGATAAAAEVPGGRGRPAVVPVGKGGAGKTPVGGGGVGAMLGGRADTVPKSGVATRPQGEGGAAQMSGINLAGVGY